MTSELKAGRIGANGLPKKAPTNEKPRTRTSSVNPRPKSRLTERELKAITRNGLGEILGKGRELIARLGWHVSVIESSARLDDDIAALRRKLSTCRNKAAKDELTERLQLLREQKALVAPAARRIEDTYGVAWPILNAAETPGEVAGLVREKVLAVASVEGTLESRVRAAISSISNAAPALHEQVRGHEVLVRAAVKACAQTGRGNRSRSDMKALLNALGLPHSRSTMQRAANLGRSWKRVVHKHPQK